METPYRDAPPAMVRFFGLVAPGVPGDTSYAYLTAIAATGAQVRAIPIGPAAALGFEKRWWRIGKLFTQPLTKPYINVVCAPLAMPMGAQAAAGALASKEMLEADIPPQLKQLLAGDAASAAKRPEPIYKPQTVIEGMWTKGCKNVAIVTLGDAMLGIRERHALMQYDRVICSRMADAVVLNTIRGRVDGLGMDFWAMHVPADELTLARLEEICESGITATTVASPATPAPPATTSSPSTTSTTSSSRSPSSETISSVPRIAMAPWTPWPFASIGSWARRIWRSFTRRLAFWRR